MSTPNAGWYPDPTAPGTQRYWDGTQWTEHTAPLPQSAPTVPMPAQPTYPTVPSATDPYAMADPYATGSAYGTGPYATGTQTPQEPKKSNTGLIVGIILLVLALVGGAIFALTRGLGSGSDSAATAEPPAPATPTEDSPEPTPEATTDEATPEPTTEEPTPEPSASALPLIVPGQANPGTVPANGAWSGQLVVDEGAVWLLRAAGVGETDLVLTVSGPDGFSFANDDYPQAAGALVDTMWDPLVAAWLEPGIYQVDVTEFDGYEIDFNLYAQAVIDATELTPGVSANLAIAENSVAAGYFDVVAGQSVTVDARALDDSDLLLSVVEPDGYVWESDDRDDGEGSVTDSLVEISDAFPGRYVVLIGEYNGLSGSATVLVTVE